MSHFDKEQLKKLMTETKEQLSRQYNEIHYQNFEYYLDRARLHFVMGHEPVEILDDLWLANRCIFGLAPLHFYKLGPEKLMTRHIIPVELAMLGGDLRLAEHSANDYGLPIMMLIAGLAPKPLQHQARLFTTFFDGSCCRYPKDLAGLGALTYAGAIASFARDFPDEAAIALQTFMDTFVDFPPPPKDNPAMVPILRYHSLCAALIYYYNRSEDQLNKVLESIISVYDDKLRHQLGDEYWSPKKVPHYLDLSALCIITFAVLANLKISLGDKDIFVPYQRLADEMSASLHRGDTRVIEEDVSERLRSLPPEIQKMIGFSDSCDLENPCDSTD